MTSRPSIVEFLRARLDEDERVTRGEITRREVWQRKLDRMRRINEIVGIGLIDYDGPGAPGDPARVLAEVEAKRRIIDYCESAIEAGGIKPGSTWNDDAAGAEVGEAVLHLMALLYAGHPDYDPAWAPVEEETVP